MPAQVRGGVYMPAKKAMIFDVVKRHPTITIEGIIGQLDDGSTKNCIRQHIFQINELLASTDLRISGDEPHLRGCYIIATTSRRRRG